jgi:hypothetical protein
MNGMLHPVVGGLIFWLGLGSQLHADQWVSYPRNPAFDGDRLNVAGSGVAVLLAPQPGPAASVRRAG